MSVQPELYRKPFKPGYLGSYNWPAMALGCILFLLTNWAATEYIAMRFAYQPVLGDPLFQVGHTPVYSPFAWFLWGLHNITSHAPAVRRPLGEGIAIDYLYQGPGRPERRSDSSFNRPSDITIPPNCNSSNAMTNTSPPRFAQWRNVSDTASARLSGLAE